MPVILIDGPEKAGKSTLIAALRMSLGARVRAWGQVSPDDRVYTEPLGTDITSPKVHIWDRGWISEAVYGSLLNRPRRLSKDWWLAEWLHGRALHTDGLAVVLLGPSDSTLKSLRKEDDLKVEVAAERETFRQYATRFGIGYYENEHNRETVDAMVRYIEVALQNRLAERRETGLHAPHYAGPLNARVVFVGQDRNESSKFPGAWLPFSTRLTQLVGRQLGDAALRCGWTNAQAVPPQCLNGKIVVACGELAHRWAATHAEPEALYVVKHPAWMYRYRNESTDLAHAQLTETILRIKEQING